MKNVFLRMSLFLGVMCICWYFQDNAAKAQGVSGTVATAATVPTSSTPVIGQPFRISPGKVDEIESVVVYNHVDKEYLVLWVNIRPGDDDIYAQRIAENGQFLSWFFVAVGNNPAVAYNEKNNTYLVVFERFVGSDYDIYARRVNFRGPQGKEFPIAINGNDYESKPRVAYNTHPNHNTFLVVWHNETFPPATPSLGVEGQRVAGQAGSGDFGGETIGSRLLIASNNDLNYEPDVAYNLNMNEYLVVYTQILAAGGDFNVHGRRVTANGILLAEKPIDSSGGDQSEPRVAAYRENHDTPYLVIFADSWNDPAGDVRGYLVDKQGQPVSLVNISTAATVSEYEPSISQNEAQNGYFVTWTKQKGAGDSEIFGRLVSHKGVTEPAFRLSKYNQKPSGCFRLTSNNAIGVVSALAIWVDICGSSGGIDIMGRMVGYQVQLPLAVR